MPPPDYNWVGLDSHRGREPDRAELMIPRSDEGDLLYLRVIVALARCGCREGGGPDSVVNKSRRSRAGIPGICGTPLFWVYRWDAPIAAARRWCRQSRYD